MSFEVIEGDVTLRKSDGTEVGTISDPVRVDPTGTTAQPVTDNAGSLTTDTPQLPGALVGGRLDVNAGAWLGSTAPTVGQKAMSSSVPHALATEHTDGSGRPLAVGPAADGAAPVGNPLLVSGYDGSNVRRVRTRVDGTVQTHHRHEPTFVALGSAIALANLKSMLAIFNASASNVIRVHRVSLINAQSTSVTGVVATFELRRLSASSGGTTITPQQCDTGDTLDGSVTVRTNGTFTEGGVIHRVAWSSDEYGAGTLDQEGYDHAVQVAHPFWGRRDLGEEPIILRQNEGLHVKCATNTTAGSWDVLMIFSQVSAGD